MLCQGLITGGGGELYWWKSHHLNWNLQDLYLISELSKLVQVVISTPFMAKSLSIYMNVDKEYRQLTIATLSHQIQLPSKPGWVLNHQTCVACEVDFRFLNWSACFPIALNITHNSNLSNDSFDSATFKNESRTPIISPLTNPPFSIFLPQIFVLLYKSCCSVNTHILNLGNLF